MKVLQVNCVYEKGSTGKITYDLHQGLLKAGIESLVCYGRGERINEPGVYKTCSEWYSKLNNALSRITGVMYGGCFFSTNRLISIIKKEKPDIVHLQCINGYFVNIYRLIRWLKKNKTKTVLTLHAEFMYTANCGHALECGKWKTGCGNCPRRKAETKSLLIDGTAKSWKKMKDAFEGFDELIITSVSPWLMERATQSPLISDNNHFVVMNGLNTDLFHQYEVTDFRKKMCYENKNVVFHATAYFSTEKGHFKGGWYICELAKRMPDVQFVVAGPHEKNIIVPPNILLLGKVLDQVELAKFYSLADVTVVTSKKETFSMVVAESLCCGTPVVGFKAGGPEQIAISEYSRFVEYGDIEALVYAAQRTIKKVKNNADEISSFACKKYGNETMVSEYTKVYKYIYERTYN